MLPMSSPVLTRPLGVHVRLTEISTQGERASRDASPYLAGPQGPARPAVVVDRRPVARGSSAMSDVLDLVGDSLPLASSLLNRVAVVTGGGTGIGRVVCQALARHGAQIVVVGRRSETLHETVELLHGETGRSDVATGAQADVTVQDDIERVMALVDSRYGRVDVLVNCAAIQGPIAPFIDVDIDAWARTIETDLIGPARMARAVFPYMARQGSGCIVNFSGGGATSPRPNLSAYAAAKAGIVRLTETLAVEGRPFGIRIYAIAPGAINTAMLDEVIRAGSAAGGEYEAAVRRRATGGDSTAPIEKLIVYLATGGDEGSLSGKLIAAQHDDWQDLAARGGAITSSDWYTLRRVDPSTLGRLPTLDDRRS